MGRARWENLINAAGVSWRSPSTSARRIDPRLPTCLPSTGQQGIPITLAALLSVDTDLTQRTHGRLLAALSFNNRYPSPSSSSPSINSVVFCVCLFWPFHLALFFFALSVFCNTFQTPKPDFEWLLLLSEASFHLPSQPGFHTLIQSLRLPLSHLLFSFLHRRTRSSNPQQKIL